LERRRLMFANEVARSRGACVHLSHEHSTVQDVLAPGLLRAATGIHYQEFTNLAEPVRLTPDLLNVAIKAFIRSGRSS
jgi:hypothetical protein